MNIKHKSYRAASGVQSARSRRISLALRNGEVAALVGPSGCGKTTLLRILSGWTTISKAGSAAGARQARRRLSGAAALALALRRRKREARGAARRASGIDDAIRHLELSEHRRHYPGELSLGLARRVALARAFAVKPDLLVLDEPFVSLDDALAAKLRAELVELVSRRPVTTLIVTHNLEEAIGLADRVFLLSGSPAHVLRDVPIERPRIARRAEEIAAIRSTIELRVDQG